MDGVGRVLDDGTAGLVTCSARSEFASSAHEFGRDAAVLHSQSTPSKNLSGALGHDIRYRLRFVLGLAISLLVFRTSFHSRLDVGKFDGIDVGEVDREETFSPRLRTRRGRQRVVRREDEAGPPDRNRSAQKPSMRARHTCESRPSETGAPETGKTREGGVAEYQTNIDAHYPCDAAMRERTVHERRGRGLQNEVHDRIAHERAKETSAIEGLDSCGVLPDELVCG